MAQKHCHPQSFFFPKVFRDHSLYFQIYCGFTLWGLTITIMYNVLFLMVVKLYIYLCMYLCQAVSLYYDGNSILYFTYTTINRMHVVYQSLFSLCMMSAGRLYSFQSRWHSR